MAVRLFRRQQSASNPIVRLDRRDTHGNRMDGYSLIPEDLQLPHAEDFSDDVQFAVHLDNLIRQLSESLPPVGKLVAVPELPPAYRAQPERLKALRDLLLPDLQKPVVVTGAAARVGLQGMGGIGKSVPPNYQGNPLRCWAITVSGFTTSSAERQFAQKRQSRIQKQSVCEFQVNPAALQPLEGR